MALELPGYAVPAFDQVGLPWPGIDEDQLRAWGASVRTFADGLRSSASQTQQAVADLADSSRSSFTHALAAHCDHHNQLVVHLHGQLDNVADALDTAAAEVVSGKQLVISALETLTSQLNAAHAGTAPASASAPALLSGETGAARETVAYALATLEGQLTMGLIYGAAQQASDHVDSFLAGMHDAVTLARQEVQSLTISYESLNATARTIRGNATTLANDGEASHAAYARRDLSDHGVSGNSDGDGGDWLAVFHAAEQTLDDLARTLFATTADAVAKYQRAVAAVIDAYADQVKAADRRDDRADYQDGVRLAKTLDSTGDYPAAARLLAQHAGDPYFTAGLLNNMNVEQIVAIMTWPNSAYPAPPGTDKAIATAMADGTLSPRTMRELVNWLTSPTANSGGNQWMTNPLLQEIAKNRAASVRLIEFIGPTRPQGSAQIENLLKTYQESGAENSVLQIMANAVDAAPPRQSEALITALVTDLSVLNSTTISQSGQGMSAFMRAAAARLLPAAPSPAQLANPAALDDWFNAYSDNLQVLAPLLNEIGTAFQSHVEDITFWRGFYEGVFMSVALAALPVDGLVVAGAEGAFSAEIQPYIDMGVSQLFPAGEDGAEAQQANWQQLQKIVIVAGVVRAYTAAGDKAGAEQLLKNPEFYKAINTWVTYQGKRSAYDAWLRKQQVRLPGGQEYTLQDMIANLASGVNPGTFP